MPYSLDELARNVDLNVHIDKVAADSVGRNCALFVSLSRWAKRHKAIYASALGQIDFRTAVEQQARAFNAQFTNPLGESEIRSTVKSVSNYVWNRWQGRPNLGIMNLCTSLPLEVKQSLSAKRTNELKVEKSVSKILCAARELGSQVTQQAVAKRAGVSLRTVATYLKSIREELSA